jgi:hypothetical protein
MTHRQTKKLVRPYFPQQLTARTLRSAISLANCFAEAFIRSVKLHSLVILRRRFLRGFLDMQNAHSLNRAATCTLGSVSIMSGPTVGHRNIVTAVGSIPPSKANCERSQHRRQELSNFKIFVRATCGSLGQFSITMARSGSKLGSAAHFAAPLVMTPPFFEGSAGRSSPIPARSLLHGYPADGTETNQQTRACAIIERSRKRGIGQI